MVHLAHGGRKRREREEGRGEGKRMKEEKGGGRGSRPGGSNKLTQRHTL